MLSIYVYNAISTFRATHILLFIWLFLSHINGIVLDVYIHYIDILLAIFKKSNMVYYRFKMETHLRLWRHFHMTGFV